MLLCLQEGVQITLSEVNTTSQWVLREWRRITSEQDKQRSQKRWYSLALTRSDVSMTSQSVLKEWKRITTEQEKRRSQKRWYSIHTLWGLLTPSRGNELGTSSTSAPTEQHDEGHSTSSMADDLRSISAIQHWTLERAKHAVTKWRLTNPQPDGTEHKLVCLERSLQHARAATGAFNILSIMLRGRNPNSRVYVE
ncbi:hypothetical protein Poli38472_007074 [Pythium oligandrum]|uniref:Uncharacterized protein n=1 Tax=Pythium oligandrum TaxID=41045 RepID=A0A8K1C924_PYTOL|nr:hypothetical protein Poli38472_007074 [Pythium oligandrum]|eukprot:TMW58929.1 hypothetical protein Poli38472_007074 [Pythium oligandrum]